MPAPADFMANTLQQPTSGMGVQELDTMLKAVGTKTNAFSVYGTPRRSPAFAFVAALVWLVLTVLIWNGSGLEIQKVAN